MKTHATKPRLCVGHIQPRIHGGRIVVVTKREDGVIEIRWPKVVRPYGEPRGAA